MLNTDYGNITPEGAEILGRAAVGGTERVAGCLDDHIPGATEPWVSRLVADFVVARGAQSVLETGSFVGATSIWIYDALCRLGGGTFHICELNPERVETVKYRLRSLPNPGPVSVRLASGDALQFLKQTPEKFDLAWVDDTHTKEHVGKELKLLLKKMLPGGLILLHDVYGSCDLRTVVQKYGGHSIDLPRMGPAGGLGIIQCP